MALTPERRQEIGRQAARARWGLTTGAARQKIGKHLTQATTATAWLSSIIHTLEDTKRVELEHWLHRYNAAFLSILDCVRYELPELVREDVAAVVDEIRAAEARQQKEAQSPTGS